MRAIDLYFRTSNWFLLIAIVLTLSLIPLSQTEVFLAIVFAPMSLLCTTMSGIFRARAKGFPLGFGLFGLLHVPGIILLMLIPSRLQSKARGFPIEV